MIDPPPILQPPRRILLATDLASHSDRALDRAIQLARQWRASLHVVHALGPDTVDEATWPEGDVERGSDDARIALVRRQITRDLRGEIDDAVIHVAIGDPLSVIRETAEREGCELVIAGAGEPAFPGFTFHTTTAQLLRRSPQSVLIVKARPHDTYHRLLVGTDFTRESRQGLETAAAWFDDADFTLMHVLDIPYKSLLLDNGREAELTRMEEDTMQTFLAEAAIPQSIRDRIRTHVAWGHPENLLSEHGVTNDVDLTVLGALTRGWAFHMMIGGNAARIIQAAPGDVLMVRA